MGWFDDMIQKEWNKQVKERENTVREVTRMTDSSTPPNIFGITEMGDWLGEVPMVARSYKNGWVSICVGERGGRG